MTLDSTSQWADIKKYEEILSKDPRSYCFAPLAEMYRKLGLLDDALSTAQKGCAIYPYFASGQLVLGCSLLDKGDEAAGRQALEKVVSIAPDNLTAQRLLSQLYIASGEYAAAEAALNVILSLDFHDTESRLVLESLPRFSPATPSVGVVSSPLDVGSNVSSFTSDESTGAFLETHEFEGVEEIIDLTEELLEEVDEPLEEVALPSATEPKTDVPLATATMAELYVQQGFVQQAIGIYQELLAEDPANGRFSTRLNQLMGQSISLPTAEPELATAAASVDMADTAGTSQMVEGGLLATLEHWLDNIRRIKACRSKSA